MVNPNSLMSESSEFFIELSQSSLRVKKIEYQGEKQSPDLVFLHEGLGCIESWKDLPELLAMTLQCDAYIYDRIGYGKSSGFKSTPDYNYLHTEALMVLPDIIEQLSLDKPILIGHSDGASIGIIFAGTHQKKLSALVAQAPHLFVEPVTIEGINKTSELFFKGYLKDSLYALHGNKTDFLFHSWRNIWTSDGFKHWNIEKYLFPIKVPILAFQGQLDEYASIEQLKSINKNSSGIVRSFLIDACGHSPHKQAKERVFSEIVSFITSNVNFS